MNRPVEGAFRAILAYGCFAAFHALGKELGRRYSTSQVLATGSLAAAALTAAVLFGRGEATAARVRPHLLLLRGAISGATALCMFHALGRLPITTTYSLSLLGPVVAAVLSALLLGERLDRRRVLAALAGFAGVLVVLRPAPGSLGTGHLAALSVAVLFAGNAVRSPAGPSCWRTCSASSSARLPSRSPPGSRRAGATSPRWRSSAS